MMNTITYLDVPAGGALSADSLCFGSSATSRPVTCPRRCCATRSTRFGLIPVRQMLAGTRDFFDTGLSFAAVLLVLGGSCSGSRA